MTFNEWLLSQQNQALQKQIEKGGSEALYWKGVFDGLDKVLKDRPTIIQPVKENELDRVKRMINRMMMDIRNNGLFQPTIQLMGTTEQKNEHYRLKDQYKILETLYHKL